MKDERLDELLERVPRRPLDAAEMAKASRLAAGEPQVLDRLREDQALSSLLRRLPDAPVSADFTASVLRTLAREGAQASSLPRESWWHFWFRPAPRLAFASLLGCLIVAGFWAQGSATRRDTAAALRRVGRPVALAAEIAQLPAAEILRDFEAIQRLDRSPVAADGELLAALLPEGARP